MKIYKVSLLILAVVMLVSCSVQKPLSGYRNVLILGNSITRHKPAPEMGWYGDWGMAASTRDSDYVHILIKKFQTAAPACKVHYKNIADYERGYWTYDLKKLDSLKQTKPQLIIVRLGENVDTKTAEEHDFQKHYPALIEYLTNGDKKVKVIHGSSFWKKPTIAQAISSASQSRGDRLVDLSTLAADPTNMALDKFTNKGVAMHPSDKGMRKIAEALWAEAIK